MKKIRNFLLKSICFIGLISLAPSSMAAVGGLTYGYIGWPANPSYYNMDQKIRIDTAPLAHLNQGYFWSYQFSAGQMVGYFGIQQLPDGNKIVNAAIWDTNNAVAGNGFTAAPFGGEGTGMRLYGPYSWIPGRIYRLRISLISQDWWGFYIQDTVTKVDTLVGKIQNQFDPGKQLDGSVTFTEQFIGPDTCADVAAVRSTWFYPTANNGTVTATHIDGLVGDSGGSTKCGNQIVSVTNKVSNTNVNQQIVCTGGAKTGLLGTASCWRYGDFNQSCQDVCTANGLDTTFWPNGQDISKSQCSTLQSAFDNTGNAFNYNWKKNGGGCMSYHPNGTMQLLNVIHPSWSASYKNILVKRFCGCGG